MQKRRTVLTTIGTVGTVAIAGCSGSSDNQEEEQEEEPEPAEFSIESVSNDDLINPDNSTSLQAEIENIGGEDGSIIVNFYLDGKLVGSKTANLSSDEQQTIESEVRLNNSSFNEYNFTVQTNDDRRETTFKSIPEPFAEPERVPPHTVENRDDISYEGVVRYDFDVITTSENASLLDHEIHHLKDICKHQIRSVTSNEAVNAISFNFWREGQTIGAERAQAVIDWAPNGGWSQADNVKSGNYNKHEFNVNGLPYVDVDVEHPETVERNESFTVEWELDNRGFAEADVSGIVQKDHAYEEKIDSFDLSLEIGEEHIIRIRDSTDELAWVDYSLEGSDKLHGTTWALIEIK